MSLPEANNLTRAPHEHPSPLKKPKITHLPVRYG
jgi:hypothetical protein